MDTEKREWKGTGRWMGSEGLMESKGKGKFHAKERKMGSTGRNPATHSMVK